MRTFEHFPKEKLCIICKKNTDSECTLIGIDGTQEGGNERAEPVHTTCLFLRISPEAGFIYQKYEV
jgi:hypothetical protein